MTFGQYVGWSRAARIVCLERIPNSELSPDQRDELDQLLGNG